MNRNKLRRTRLASLVQYNMKFVANTPHIKCWVRKEYLQDFEKGHGEFVEAVIVAVKSVQGRALIFEAYLPEYGACYDKLPIVAFVWKKDHGELLELNQLEMWDSFSSNIHLWKKQLLGNCDVEVWISGNIKMNGEYLFTIDSCHGDPQTIDTGVSEVPEEHNQFNFGKLDSGQFFAYPNNRMRWFEQSLTPKTLKTPDFKVSTKTWFCEQESKRTFGDTNDYFYKEEERE